MRLIIDGVEIPRDVEDHGPEAIVEYVSRVLEARRPVPEVTRNTKRPKEAN